MRSLSRIERPEEPPPTGFLAEMRDWCRGRVWYYRLPIVLALAYVGYQKYQDPAAYTWFTGLNIAIHEGGHILFRPFGIDLWVAGGTIAQLAAPLIAMYLLLQQPDYFGIPLCLGWLSTNLCDVGVYMSDAVAMALPLVTEGGAPIDPRVMHDWHYLFSRLGLLNQDEIIGLCTEELGDFVMLAALLVGVWLMVEMAAAKKRLVRRTI